MSRFTRSSHFPLRRRRFALESLEIRRALAADALHSALALPAEGEAPVVEVAPEGEPIADFSLLDVNPNSATANQRVSPRDFQGQMSAWYFAHAT